MLHPHKYSHENTNEVSERSNNKEINNISTRGREIGVFLIGFQLNAMDTRTVEPLSNGYQYKHSLVRKQRRRVNAEQSFTTSAR